MSKIKSIMKKRGDPVEASNLENTTGGAESPLTPQLLEGNFRFDKYLQSKLMVNHRNQQRELSQADQLTNEKALRQTKGNNSKKYDAKSIL